MSESLDEIFDGLVQYLRGWPRIYRLLRSAVMLFRKPRHLAGSIRRDAEYSIQLLRGYEAAFAEDRLPIAGLHILEIGPGINLAPQLMLTGLGAEITVSDRFSIEWDPRYHPALYRRLSETWSGPRFALDDAVGRNTHDGLIKQINLPLEELCCLDEQFDIVLSNAVLEHVYDMERCAEALLKLTKPGGLNHHQIDFRDHQNFNRPLEFLLLDEAAQQVQFNSTVGKRGNRWRHSEWIDAFRRQGFTIERFYTTETANPKYLKDLLPRLRQSPSRYRDWPESDLCILSSHVKVRRPA